MANTSKKYKCPFCDYRHFSDKLTVHIEKSHEDLIPEGFTPARLVYNVRNKREFGSCMMCKKPTEWNESTGRYMPFCSETCHEKYVKRFENNMIRVRGKARILDDMDQQAKMLANRRISGKYKFTDGGERTYTGSYERKALEFLDKVFGVKSIDIMTPGPTLEYNFNGETHHWITDIYWVSMNLIIEVKDGGDNPNKRDMPVYRAKQTAKEVIFTDKGNKFNYLRLTNNNFEQLFNTVAEIKANTLNEDDSPVININEATILHELPGVAIGGVPGPGSSGYLIDKGFNFKREFSDPNYIESDPSKPNEDKDKEDYEESVLANDLVCDKIIRLKDGIPTVESFDYLKGSKLTIWKFKGSKQKFLEVASSKKPIESFYEALTGKKEYTKDQIEFDPLFEKVNVVKMVDSIEENRINTLQEAAAALNVALPYLPVFKIPDITKKEIVKAFDRVAVAEDANGYFFYNKDTYRRSVSKKNINELILENTSVMDDATGNDAVENIEAKEYELASMNKMINTNVKNIAQLNIEKDKFDELDHKSKVDSDSESIRIYGKTNLDRYREKAHEFLKQDLPKTPDKYNGTGVVKSESEIRSDITNLIIETYSNIAVANRDYSWMMHEFANLKYNETNIDRYRENELDQSIVDKLNEAIDSYYIDLDTEYILGKYKVDIVKESGSINLVLKYNPKGYKIYSNNKIKNVYTESNTYNFDLVNYTKADVERAKQWSLQAMMVIIVPTKTLEELELLWNQFEQQDNEIQKDSDAMSMEIFGMDNNTHYVYIKRKFLKKDIDTDHIETYDGVDTKFEESTLMNYKLPLIFSGNDLYYKYEQFSEGYTNILFITGLSGEKNYQSILKEDSSLDNSKVRHFNLDNFYKDIKSHNLKEPFNQYAENTIIQEPESDTEMIFGIISFIKEMATKTNYKFIFEGSIIPELFEADYTLIDKSSVVCEQKSIMHSLMAKIKTVTYNAVIESINDISNTISRIDNENDFREHLAFFEEAIPRLDANIHTNTLMPTIFATDLPFFTPSQYDEFYSGNLDDIPWVKEYAKLFAKGKASGKFLELNRARIRELNEVFTNNPSNKDRILALGWNPEIPFTIENRIKVDTKLNSYLGEVFRVKTLEEKTLPIEIDDKSIWIGSKIDDDFQRMYSDTHRLLLAYEKANNIDGMKYELVKLWYIARRLDAIVYNNKSKYYKDKQLLVLRAWVLNDFNKYLAIVLKNDPKFNFTKYFNKSEYAKRLKIDKRTLKYTYDYLVTAVKSFLK